MEAQKIYAALAKFAKECPTVVKDAVNPHFKSKYASLTQIQQTIAKPLADAGLVATHSVTPDSVVSKIVCVEDGSLIESSFPFTVGKPQENGSAITYAKRYNLSALLDLDVDDDDDGNVAHSNATAPRSDAKPVQATRVAKPVENAPKKWFCKFIKGSKTELTKEWKDFVAKKSEYPSAEDAIMDIKVKGYIIYPASCEEDIRKEFIADIPF